MTNLIVQTDNEWTKRKIIDAIHIEAEILKKAAFRTQDKLRDFETRYGKLNRKTL